jgi:hypothetical protein
MPVLAPGYSGQAANQLPQTIALSGASQPSTTPVLQGQILLLTADTNCWVAFGQAAVIGGAGSFLVTATHPLLVRVPSQANAPYPGQGNSGALGQVSLNAIGTTGNLNICPMINS